MNALSDQQLLREYAHGRQESAFTELVSRHVDLVYSAAQRMLCDGHLAQDVTQGVFVALAENAGRLAGHPVLSGWLHCTARNLAVKAIRSDARRRVREQEAATMNELSTAEPDVFWETISPHLDAALGELNGADREALMLRYFEKKSAADMAGILGISEEAAQKRVSRAMERLRELFASRGMAVGASSLAIVITANAVQAAPAGLAASISTGVLAGTAISTSSIIAATKTIAMTTLQKVIITLGIAALAGAGIYEAHKASQLSRQVQALQQQQAPLEAQIQQALKERDNASNQLASVQKSADAGRRPPTEMLKLRGEVGALRQEQKMAAEKSALSKLTANPETRKMIRDQQKLGMSVIYKGFAKNLNLTPEMTDKLNDLLADNIMDKVDLVTQALHDGKSRGDIDPMFAASEQQVESNIGALLGDDALAKYKSYTQNLASTLTADQFADELTGDKSAKEQKKEQFQQIMQEETVAALKNAGLPPDYQVVPILNFGNIASSEEGDQSLQLLDGIYSNVAARSSAFLTADEMASFQTFRTNALNNSRAVLSVNRTMMAPLGQ
jgi:RNA polymerase sigma factor (sigma-70 family)